VRIEERGLCRDHDLAAALRSSGCSVYCPKRVELNSLDDKSLGDVSILLGLTIGTRTHLALSMHTSGICGGVWSAAGLTA